MRPARLLVIAVLLAAPAGSARADGWYFTESLGGSDVSGEMSQFFEGPSFAARIALGRRVDRLAIEGFVEGISLEGTTRFDSNDYTAVSYGVDAKYMFPASEHLELYVRGGLNGMQMTHGMFGADESEGAAYGGRGISYGAGIQLKGKVRALGFLAWPLFFTKIGPKVTGAIYFDTGQQFVRLHHPYWRSLDGNIRTWKFGFAVGTDF